MDKDFYIIENFYINPEFQEIAKVDTCDTISISDSEQSNDSVFIEDFKLELSNLNKLFVFMLTYKLSTINWAFLQLPDFVSRHI